MACITKRKGLWAVDFYDQHGKRRLKMLPKGSTKKKARELLREIEDQVGDGTWLPEPEIPKFERVASDWLEFKKPNVRASTWDMYRGHLENHFDEINGIKINRINVARVEKFITKRMLAEMNIGTLKKLIVTFNQIMKYAVRHGYISYNPVRDAERPKGKSNVTESKIKVLNPVQIKALLDATENFKYRTLFMFAIMTGARQGEIVGLKWSDIDWFNCQVYIQRTFNNNAWYEPKSKTSKRQINLGPSMINALKQWKPKCPKSRFNLVFPNEVGKPLDHWHLLDRYYWPALKAAELPRIRFHDLRHTFASLLIEQGENIKYIQDQLGHSSATLTLDVYGHLLKPVNQEAAQRLENSVFSGNGDQMATNRQNIIKLVRANA